MKETFARAFFIFEIIFSIIITNMIFVAGSIVSLFILFPVMLVSTLNYIRNFYYYKEKMGIIYTFFAYMKGKFLISLKAIYPLLLVVLFLLVSIYYYNGIMNEVLPFYMIVIIYIIQFFVLYQLLGIMLITSLQIITSEDQEIFSMYRNSFIFLNSRPIRNFFALLSFLVVLYVSLLMLQYAYFIFVPISLFAFYIVISDTYEKYELK